MLSLFKQHLGILQGNSASNPGVYFSIADFLRIPLPPTVTITHHGGVDIEELGKDEIAQRPVRGADGQASS